jgi:hypothetical protein
MSLSQPVATTAIPTTIVVTIRVLTNLRLKPMVNLTDRRLNRRALSPCTMEGLRLLVMEASDHNSRSKQLMLVHSHMPAHLLNQCRVLYLDTH